MFRLERKVLHKVKIFLSFIQASANSEFQCLSSFLRYQFTLYLNMNAGQSWKKRCDLAGKRDAVNLKIKDGMILSNPLLASNADIFQQKPDFSLR